MVSQGDEDKVNLFFITDYTDAAYLGNAAGIPGSQGLKGSHNGVLINLSAHKTGGSLNNQLLGETAGHEMGHFLGLFILQKAEELYLIRLQTLLNALYPKIQIMTRNSPQKNVVRNMVQII